MECLSYKYCQYLWKDSYEVVIYMYWKRPYSCKQKYSYSFGKLQISPHFREFCPYLLHCYITVSYTSAVVHHHVYQVFSNLDVYLYWREEKHILKQATRQKYSYWRKYKNLNQINRTTQNIFATIYKKCKSLLLTQQIQSGNFKWFLITWVVDS